MPRSLLRLWMFLSLVGALAPAGGCLHKRLGPGVRGNPTDDEAWGDAGDAEASLGNRDLALTDYKRALMIDPRDSEWQRKVMEFGGEAAFREVIDVTLPDSSWSDDEALGDRGDAFASAGMMSEACALYRRASAYDTQDTEWQGKVAECNTSEGTDTADLTSNSGVLAALGYASPYDYAEGGVEGGVYGGTLTGSIGGILGTPADAYVDSYAYDYGGLGYGGLGYVGSGYASGDPAAVTAALEHARQAQKPEAKNALWSAILADPAASDLRAMWTMLTGETSVTLLTKVSEAKPDDPAVWGALGDAKLAAGKRSEAITAWQKAAALAPYDLTWSNRLEMAKVTAVKTP